jgi:hypothetical protein
MTAGAVISAACVVFVGYLVILRIFADAGGTSGFSMRGGAPAYINTKNGREKIFQLALPEKVWSIDKEVRVNFKARPGDTESWFAEAWKHNDEDVWFAIVARDYGMQKPRDAEMLRVTVDKLEQHFGEAVEAAVKPEEAKFAGQAAQKLRFKGIVKSALWQGDCYMFFKSGFAYWFFIASPDLQVARDWSDMLQKEDTFSVQVVERRGWRALPAPTEKFADANGSFTLTVPEGVWEKNEAKNEDERGLLLLLGRYKREKNNLKNASVLVFTMDRQADLKEAMKAARADVEAKKKEENSNYKLVSAGEVVDEVKGQAEFGESEDLGSQPGRIADLCLKLNDDVKRYVFLGVANGPNASYVFRCDCTWDSRQIWRKDFLDLLHTFTLVKKGA